jgi:hypothetical protein
MSHTHIHSTTTSLGWGRGTHTSCTKNLTNSVVYQS